MKPYISVVSIRFKMLLQYRSAALAGFATQLFWGLMRVMIFEAFYKSTNASQPMDLSQVITYVWLGQAMLAMFPWNVDNDIRIMMRSGNIAYELLKPIDIYWFWFARAIALRTAPMFLRAIPMFAIAILFFGMKLPDSLASGFLWIISMGCALLLSCAITTFMNISLFWTIAGEGIFRFTTACVMIFSGMLIPLPLFPDNMQSFLNFMPFRGVTDTPFRFYTSNISSADTIPALMNQLIWITIFILAGRLILKMGIRKLVIQGG